MKKINLLAITIPVGIPVIIWKGYVFSRLWAWFIVPLNVPAIEVAQAVGIVTIIKLLDADSNMEEVDEGYLTNAIVAGLIGPAISLLIGWVAHGWMQ